MASKSTYEAAVGLLARREHSQQELLQKLGQRGHDAEEIEQALQRLVEAGLQSDERFVLSFVRSRVQRGQGPVRIRAELAKRGVRSVNIEQQLENAGEAVNWFDLAQEVLDRKWPSPPGDMKERQRAMRFLAQRGFPAEIVGELLN